MNSEHKQFLDNLRESGLINMCAAAPVLKGEFPELDIKEARKILIEWMESF